MPKFKTEPLKKGVPPKLRQWLNSLLEDAQTCNAIPGKNISIDNQTDGQVINAIVPDETTT
jgi:hypothetical protein